MRPTGYRSPGFSGADLWLIEQWLLICVIIFAPKSAKTLPFLKQNNTIRSGSIKEYVHKIVAHLGLRVRFHNSSNVFQNL